jgi:hypothetical protein
MSFCRECEKEVQADWVTCPYCSESIGSPVSNAIETQDSVVMDNVAINFEDSISENALQRRYYGGGDEELSFLDAFGAIMTFGGLGLIVGLMMIAVISTFKLSDALFSSCFLMMVIGAIFAFHPVYRREYTTPTSERFAIFLFVIGICLTVYWLFLWLPDVLVSIKGRWDCGWFKPGCGY